MFIYIYIKVLKHTRNIGLNCNVLYTHTQTAIPFVERNISKFIYRRLYFGTAKLDVYIRYKQIT